MKNLISMQQLDELLNGWGAKQAICDLLGINWKTLHRYLTDPEGKTPMPIDKQIAIVALLKFTKILKYLDRGSPFTLEDLEAQWSKIPFKVPKNPSPKTRTRSSIRKRTSWRFGKSESKSSVESAPADDLDSSK